MSRRPLDFGGLLVTLARHHRAVDGPRGCDLLAPDGDELWVAGEDVVREDIAWWPLGPGTGETSLAVDGDGTLRVGALSQWVPGGLARCAGDRWEVIDEIDGVEIFSSAVLGSDPEGRLVVPTSISQAAA